MMPSSYLLQGEIGQKIHSAKFWMHVGHYRQTFLLLLTTMEVWYGYVCTWTSMFQESETRA